MAIRIKVDEDLPVQMAEIFAQYGHEATTVMEQGWQGLVDEQLWPRVQQEGRFLVAADKGFADLRTHSPGSHGKIRCFAGTLDLALSETLEEDGL